MKTTVEKYKAARENVENALKAARSAVKNAFDEGLKDLFAANPALIKFSWPQYTPYFNDGDECVFGVREPRITFKAGDGNVIEFHSDYAEMRVEDGRKVEYNTPEYRAYDKEGSNLTPAVSGFLGIFNEDDLKSVFGDHVEVTATSKGTELEEYEHD